MSVLLLLSLLAPADLLLTDEARLAALVWARNPDVRQAVAGVGQARAEAWRAAAWSNPELSVGANQLPVHNKLAANPGEVYPDATVGNASAWMVDVGQDLDLWRRDLRIDRARLGVKLAGEDVRGVLQARTADLLEVAVRLAGARRRSALLERQLAAVADLARVTAVGVRERAVPPLDLEKLEVETGRLQGLRDGATLELEAARAAWAALVLEAAPALDADAAERAARTLSTLPAAWPGGGDASPAARALALQREQAAADLDLAATRRFPDVGVRAGYTYNLLASNVLHSVQGSVTFGLPVWNAGQGDRLDAEARAQAAQAAAEGLAARQRSHAAALQARARSLDAIRTKLRTERLPAARATLARLERAVKDRLVPLTDVIQLRRTALDLEGDGVALDEQLGQTLVDLRRLLAWRLPEPPAGDAR